MLKQKPHTILAEKLFASVTDHGFKYSFSPFLLLSLVLILLALKHIFYPEFILTGYNILTILICALVLEVLLYFMLKKDNRVELYGGNNRLRLHVETESLPNFNIDIQRMNYFWTYDNSGDVEEEEGFFSADNPEGEITSAVQRRSAHLDRLLFLELYSHDNEKIVLVEKLDYLKQVPKTWTYKVRPIPSDDEVVSHKLDYLKNKIDERLR